MKKIDSLLKKAALFERLAVYGDRRSFLKSLGQGASYDSFKGSTMVGDSGEPGPTTQTVKETVIDDQISSNIQKKLNDILTPLAIEGKIFFAPLVPDGTLGKSTKQALETYKKEFGLQGAPFSAVLKDIQSRSVGSSAKSAPSKMNPDGTVAPMGKGLSGVVPESALKAAPTKPTTLSDLVSGNTLSPNKT